MKAAEQSPGPDLALFTHAFPYDNEESVLAAELIETARLYSRIFIIPSRKGETVTAALPRNVTLVDLELRPRLTRAEKLRSLCSGQAASVLWCSLSRASNWAAYVRGMRVYLDILAHALHQRRRLSSWIRESELQDAIFYDYWFENATLALALLRAGGDIRFCVSRAHRFDIFDSAWTEVRRVPFRDFKAAHLDAIFAVSETGAGYLRERLRSRYRDKVRVSRLGVPLGDMPPAPERTVPVLVSCSTLTERKRVALIAEALALLDRPAHWIHFGDGPDAVRVHTAASELPPHVTFEMRGQVPNSAVAAFYRAQAVAGFVSASSSEGVPVAMMEAQSCGVPIVALAVGGIPELVVSPEVGVLLPPDATAGDLCNALQKAMSPGRFDPARIRAAFATRYDSARTYPAFAESLISMAGHRLGHDSSTADVTVTTVLYNSSASLSAYAAALRTAIERRQVRVVAVDNAGPDGSAGLLAGLLPDATIVRSPGNLGFGGGCNLAWPSVDTPYWLLLNPDVRAGAQDIAALVRWMEARPSIGVASPLLIGSDGTPLAVARPHDSIIRPVAELLRLHKLVPEPWRSRLLLPGAAVTPERIRGWVPGAALMVRREAFAAAGPFNEHLFMYGEDRELCWRMRRAGWGVGVCDSVAVTHIGGTSARATWSEAERAGREVDGHLRATSVMRSDRYARCFAAINGAALWLESWNPRLEGSARRVLRRRGSAYARRARLGNAGVRGAWRPGWWDPGAS